MDFLSNLGTTQGATNSSGDMQRASVGQDQPGAGQGFMGKMNNALGGGETGEKKEDLLDKGVDFVQERALGQGQQSNESAIEQQKDEMISDTIRSQYKGMTGKDFPIADK